MRAALSLLAALAFAVHVQAAPAPAATDCPAVPALPGYQADGPADGRSYDAVEFPVQRGDGVEQQRLAGRTCTQHYTAQDGTDPMGDARIQDEYRARLRNEGAEVVHAGPATTTARLLAGGQERWLRIASRHGAIDVATVEIRPRAQVLTPPGPDDFRLLGHMPDYVTQTSDRRAYDQRSFAVRDGDEVRELAIEGARHEVDYSLRDGARPASDLDIQENYRTALAGLGAIILFTDDRNTVARLDRDGHSVWMRIWSQEAAINVSVIEQGPHRQTLLPPSPPDHPLIGHMPGYVADPPEKQALDEVIFQLPDGDDTRDVTVQGARTDIVYEPGPGALPASDLDIQLNYRGLFAALGAQILFTDAATTIARLDDGGRVLWVKVWSQEPAINLTLVKEKAFKASVRPIPAETLKATLDARGKASLHLPFVFNRAAPRADAAEMVGGIAQLLRENPALRLAIECHTDNIAPRRESLALAAARAGALRDALAAAGIDPARLTPLGIGPDRPLADNNSSENRARNRRVVLVRK
jgi:outer membrane protein OmpA-like peptidoglycan-associated protein